MLRERLTRKEELLNAYENDLSKLRQAEMVIREKDRLLQHLEVHSPRYIPLIDCHLFSRRKKERKTMQMDSYEAA